MFPMLQNIKKYYWECVCCSFKSSYDAANNMFGAALVGLAMISHGLLHFMSGESPSAQAVNGTLTVVIYTIGVWLLIFVLRMIFVSPYLVWERAKEQTANATAERAVIQNTLNDRDGKQQTRTQLGLFLSEGGKLQTACNNVAEPPPLTEADAWALEVESFLKSLDESLVSRFCSAAAAGVGYSSIKSETHGKLWSGLRIRCFNLNEFIKEYR